MEFANILPAAKKAPAAKRGAAKFMTFAKPLSILKKKRRTNQVKQSSRTAGAGR